jgi:hypothetical protein
VVQPASTAPAASTISNILGTAGTMRISLLLAFEQAQADGLPRFCPLKARLRTFFFKTLLTA